MELWSLMHFLMPNVFESHRDFKEWFSNPLTGMVEGSAEYNESLIQVHSEDNQDIFQIK
jgi:SNF2 family DNA or RNA helicase